mgnify:FL=1
MAARFALGDFVSGSVGTSKATRRSGRGEFGRDEGAEAGGVGR